jgi:hypothetical protein
MKPGSKYNKLGDVWVRIEQQYTEAATASISSSRIPLSLCILIKDCNQFHPDLPLTCTLLRLGKQHGHGDKEGWILYCANLPSTHHFSLTFSTNSAVTKLRYLVRRSANRSAELFWSSVDIYTCRLLHCLLDLELQT